jgi:hypothetical protein
MEKWLKENSSKYSDIPDNTLSSIKSRLDLLNEFKSKYFSAISNENFAKLR